MKVKKKIKLYHIGKNKLDLVTSGFKKITNINIQHLIYGLTNYRQTPHSIEKTHGNFEIFNDTPLSEITKDLLKMERVDEKNRFMGGIYDGLKLWLKSVKKLLKDNESVIIRIVKLPSKHRILARQNYINKKYGKYLIKTYSNINKMKSDEGF